MLPTVHEFPRPVALGGRRGSRKDLSYSARSGALVTLAVLVRQRQTRSSRRAPGLYSQSWALVLERVAALCNVLKLFGAGAIGVATWCNRQPGKTVRKLTRMPASIADATAK